MRFDCGPARNVRRRALREWHRWFAWHPVRVGPRDCRWLETIERRCDIGPLYGTIMSREYREAQP